MSSFSALVRTIAVAGLLLALVGFRPPPARAGILQAGCGALGDATGALGKLTCAAATHASSLARGARQLLSGHVGSAVKSVLGEGEGGVSTAATATVAFAALALWVTHGASDALKQTARYLSRTVSPHLESAWFSSVYWEMAGIASLLTLPFLFACAVQAILRSDLSMLLSAAFGYLPAALLAIFLLTPVVMLLLAATDAVCALVEHAGGPAADVLSRASALAAGLDSLAGSRFLALLLGLLVAAAAVALWIELLARATAMYIVVLMLPLVFAALVWPARRIWALRLVELLVALILSKFVIVAILVLGASALAQTQSLSGLLAGTVLVLLAAFSPWAVLRLLPHVQPAAGAAGAVRAGSSAGMSGVMQKGRLALGLSGGMAGGAGSSPEGDPEPDLWHVQAQVDRMGESGGRLPGWRGGGESPAPAVQNPDPVQPPHQPEASPARQPEVLQPEAPPARQPEVLQPEAPPARRRWTPPPWTDLPFVIDDPDTWVPSDPANWQPGMPFHPEPRLPGTGAEGATGRGAESGSGGDLAPPHASGSPASSDGEGPVSL